jgi:hypothetical protein
MAADNDLYADVLNDLEEMKQGFSEKGTNLIVFIDILNEAPYLLEIHPGKETYIQSYSELNSATPAVLAEITGEIIEMYPAQEYGLILWSHGTSWMPAGSNLRSFGKDSGQEMNIPDLAQALPVKFNFILLDACSMGAVEVAYELKDKTDFIIASSTETITDGFPYDKIVPELVEPQINLKMVAQRYFDYYNALQGAYDFFDFIDKAFPEADKSRLIAQLEKTVLYKAHTRMFLEEFEINTYCGLSTYIPLNTRTDLENYYRQLRWYKDSRYNNLF